MITTAEAPRSRTGRKYSAKRVTLWDFDALTPTAPGGDNDTLRQYYRRLLAYALERCLTDKQRQAVELYYFDGRKLGEIAGLLGVSASTLSRRLSCARRRIYRFTNDAAHIEKLRSRCGL